MSFALKPDPDFEDMIESIIRAAVWFALGLALAQVFWLLEVL